MKRPDLAAARLEATSALGRGAERTLTQLEAAGLVVVRLAELPPIERVTRTLHDVELQAVHGWQSPYRLTVTHGPGAGEVLELHALESAASAIREAFTLSRVMGHRLDVEINEGEGLVLRAWAVEP